MGRSQPGECDLSIRNSQRINDCSACQFGVLNLIIFNALHKSRALLSPGCSGYSRFFGLLQGS
jgi:hypothetical protein